MSTFNWDSDDNRCFGCGDNPYGLGLTFETDGRWVKATTSLDSNYQGFQDFAHGGIVVTLLDEAASWAAVLQRGVLAASFDLNCKLKQPVPLQQEITVVARVIDNRHDVFRTTAKVCRREEVLAKGEFKSKRIREVEHMTSSAN